METIRMSSVAPELGVRATHASPIIVATDGRDQSDAALAVGRLFAESRDALRLITVAKPLPVIPEAPSSITVDMDAARHSDLARAAREQATRIWEEDAEVELFDGDPATVVARVAHRAGATMIVCGLGRHRVTDRVFGDETALRLIRLADVPVLAAASGMHRAPRRIVVAVDFSETSLRAARLALDVASSSATIYLAHVAPRDSSPGAWNGVARAYKEDAGAALQRTREQLRVPSDMTVQNVLLQGDPATELLAFATSVNADLIATGSHGHGFVARMLIGSVTTRIVRCSTCSVLTVPHAAVMTRVRTTVDPPVVAALPRASWPGVLDDFSRRNFGRRTMLEVDDTDLGAQAQEFDYPLLGVRFDVLDERTELLFGDPATRERHLSRGISGVTSIDVMRDDRGHDLAMRIVHGTGQTLVTFTA